MKKITITFIGATLLSAASYATPQATVLLILSTFHTHSSFFHNDHNSLLITVILLEDYKWSIYVLFHKQIV
jgi:hypothetical protein